MEAQVTITLTQEEVSLLHTALCDYRGKIGTATRRCSSRITWRGWCMDWTTSRTHSS